MLMLCSYLKVCILAYCKVKWLLSRGKMIILRSKCKKISIFLF